MFAGVACLISVNWALSSAFPGIPDWFPLPSVWFDKTSLPPLRIISILSLAVLVASRVPRNARWFSSRVGWLVVICGQHSLEVFCLTIVLAVLANFALSLAGYGLLSQLSVNLAGMIIMVLFALLLSWFRSGGQWPTRPGRA